MTPKNALTYICFAEGERSSWIDSSQRKWPSRRQAAAPRRPDRNRRRLYTKIFAKQPPQQWTLFCIFDFNMCTLISVLSFWFSVLSDIRLLYIRQFMSELCFLPAVHLLTFLGMVFLYLYYYIKMLTCWVIRLCCK